MSQRRRINTADINFI